LAPADAEAHGQVGWSSSPAEEAPLGVEAQFLILLAPDGHAEEALVGGVSSPPEALGAIPSFSEALGAIPSQPA
jgi:hypothetical protein